MRAVSPREVGGEEYLLLWLGLVGGCVGLSVDVGVARGLVEK